VKDTFKDRLNKAMSLHNMKQIELSEKTGISKSRINHYVNGLYEAKQEAVYLIAKALNVSEGWLMGFDASMERTTDLNDASYEVERVEKGYNAKDEDGEYYAELRDVTKEASDQEIIEIIKYAKYLLKEHEKK